MPAKLKTKFNLEESLRELEALVERLEQGELPLEESLRQFERGIALTRACQAALEDAEQKVRILMEKNGRITARPLPAPDDTDGD